jgi:hypothetical protein
VLLLIAIYNRPLFQVLQTEMFAAELIRTMVGSIGLILAVPLTTAVGVAVVRASRRAKLPGLAKTAQAAVPVGGADREDDAALDDHDADAEPAEADATEAKTTTVPSQPTTRLRRRRKTKDDDFGFSDLRDPD